VSDQAPPPSPPPPPTSPEPPPATPGQGPEPEWQRLDPRMLLVGPFTALKQLAIPAIIAIIGTSANGFNPLVVVLAAVGLLLAGFLPWLTTRYRVTETQFQRRSGLISRKQVTAPLDRVRSVDLEAGLLHRLLGLSKVQVGTGVDDTRIELDALGTPQAEALRQGLLARLVQADEDAEVEGVAEADATPWPAPEGEPLPGEPPARATRVSPVRQPRHRPEEVLATLDWSWLRYAPLNLARLVIAAGALGALAQFGDDLGVDPVEAGRSAYEGVRSYALPALVVVLLIGGALAWTVLSMAGYALQWSGLRVVRADGSIRVNAGLLTTRSTTIEEERVRGVEIREPVLMRAAGAAELYTLATGVGSGGTTQVLPASPTAEDVRVADALLGTDEPLHVRLVRHGPRARRRAHLRQQWALLPELAATALLLLWWDASFWLLAPVAVGVAAVNAVVGELRYRHLGHALTGGHLVSGRGALARVRTVLERDGVIGWVVTQSFFQRRAGLATLTATTAAGSERVDIRDVPHATAVEVAAEATPTAVGEFLARSGGPGRTGQLP
jgi:putative membrane protein